MGTPGGHLSMPAADPATWSNAWDDEEDSSSTGGGGADVRSQDSEASIPDNASSSIVPLHSNPLMAKKHAASAAAHSSATGGAMSASNTAAHTAANSASVARTMMTNPQEMASAVSTFEKNIEDFRNKLKQVCNFFHKVSLFETLKFITIFSLIITCPIIGSKS